MALHGLDRDHEVRRDDGVGQPAQNQPQDLALASNQAGGLVEQTQKSPKWADSGRFRVCWAEGDEPASSSPADQVTADHVPHNFIGAAVYPLHPGVLECAGYRVLGHVAIPAVELQALVDEPVLHLGRPQLGLRGIHRGEVAGVVGQDGPIDECPGHVDLGGEVRKYEPGVLEVGDRLAERMTLVGVAPSR